MTQMLVQLLLGLLTFDYLFIDNPVDLDYLCAIEKAVHDGYTESSKSPSPSLTHTCSPM